MFETERLLIRLFVEDDEAGICRLVYADADVWLSWSAFNGTLEEFRERYYDD